MQQRPIVYDLAQIRSFDTLNGWVDSLVGDSNALQVVLGQTGTVIQNLIFSQTTSPSLVLNLTQGWIAQFAPVDQSAYGSIPADTSQVLQLGQSAVGSVTIVNNLTSGQNQYVLLEAGFVEEDSIASGDPNNGILPYVNVTNPSDPFSGPGNSGIAQNTVRAGICNIQVKYGTPALTGSEVPPAPDAGYVPIALVDITAGQTAITTGEIINPNHLAGYAYPSPVLAGLLNQHHLGIPGQAPQIDLTAEIKNLLPMANLLASNIVGGVSALRQGSGSPNGVLAGNANRNGVPDTYYDFTNNANYVCTTTGDSTHTVWTSTNIPSSTRLNLRQFTTSGSYTPTAGAKYIVVMVAGSGGGGAVGGGYPAGATDGGGGGGAGSTALALLPTNGLTFPATITIGTGGAGGGAAFANGSNGNNSSFATTEIGTNLVGYTGEGGYANDGSHQSNVGGRGGGVLQSAPLTGSITVNTVNYPFINIFGGPGGGGGAFTACQIGGSSALGGGGRGGGTLPGGSEVQATSGGYGAGGGGGGYPGVTAPQAGANGGAGICLVLEYIGT